MVLDSVVCYCMVILWHYMVYHVGIEWYCMMLQWSSTLIYQLRAQGHKIKSLYLKHGINHSLLVGQFCNLISFCSIKKPSPLAGSDGQKQIF